VDEQRAIKLQEAEMKNMLDSFENAYDFSRIIDSLGDKMKVVTYLESKKKYASLAIWMN